MTESIPSSAQESIRVLHVDDEPDFVEMAAAFLERESDRIEAIAATSADEGLDILAEDDIDCVVSDHDMPGQDGIEFLERVRDAHGELPFILFTGKGSEEVASDAISAGVTDYLQKESGTSQYEILANRIHNAVEQRRARQTFVQTQKRLQTLAESTDDILWMYTADWEELLFINSAYEDIWDRSIDELREYPPSFQRGVHPDDRSITREAMENLSAGESIDIEFRVNASEDFGRWVWVKGTPIFDDRGEVTQVAGFARDITERKEREQELERYERIVEAIGDGVFVNDADGRHIDINKQMSRLTGYDRETLIGEYPSLYLDEEDIAKGRRTIQELLTNDDMDVGTYEETIHTADGDTVFCAVRQTLLPSEDGEFRGSVGTVRDITERIEYETRIERLHEATDELMAAETEQEVAERTAKAAKETLDFPLTVVRFLEDGKLVPVTVSEEMKETLGTDRPTYDIGEPTAGLAFERGETVAYEDLWELDLDHDAPHTPGGSMYVPIGEYGVLTISDTEFDAFDGADIEVAEILASIAETALDRVGRIQTLNERNERLEDFASIVSHDLRNPLAVAKGRLDLAQEVYDSGHLDTVARALERMEALIDDLLTLAREGKTVEEKEPIDLTRLAESCWRNVATTDSRLVTVTDSAILADENRLQQVLENLFRNAVEHGGGDITVTIGDLDAGSGFYVEDDGVGIAEEQREQVFESGYSTTEEGTGFGLAIVEQIAQAHGWEVAITESDEGGARFEITGVEIADE